MPKHSCIYRLCKSIKLIFLVLLFSLASINVFSQKEYSRWYFGNSAGINFNTTPPSVLTDGSMSALEGSSSICDENGNLLFYTDGDSVYNRLHNLMKNGIITPGGIILTGSNRASSYRSSLIISAPNQSNKYYILNSGSAERYMTDSGYLRYSVVDMNKDGGGGAITLKNEPLIKSVGESFAVGKHLNNIDYWICAVNYSDKNFTIIRTINGDLGKINKQQSRDKSDASFPLLKFAPNSRILSLPSSRVIPGSNDFYMLYLTKFDNSNGKLSDSIQVALPKNIIPMFCEFSCNSRFLYVSEVSFKDTISNIVQYDLSVWHPDSILKSRTTVVKYFGGRLFSPAIGFQLAQNGKIYIFFNRSKKLWVINNPNKKGGDCNLDTTQIFSLEDRETLYGLPYYPTFWCNSLYVSLPSDRVACKGDTVTINAYSNGTHFLWNTSDTTKSISITKSGVYWVKAITQSDTAIDSIKVSFKEKFKVYLGNDTTFCNQFSHLLNAGVGAKNYIWNTGDTTVTKLVDQPGLYMVTVRDSNNCNSGDTINIFQQNLQAPPISVEYDSVACSYVKLSIPSQDSGVITKWSTNDTTYSVKVFNKGLYSVAVSTTFCKKNSSINIDKLSTPEVDLGPDSSICVNQEIHLKTDAIGSYNWSTGDTTSFIKVYTPGAYTLSVSRNGCIGIDTVVINKSCDNWYYIPNAFTPNHDGLNGVFAVVGGENVSAKMWVFNRWGEKIFYGEGGNASWDGTYKGEICQEGVYIYIIQIIIPTINGVEKKNLKGNVTLIR